LVLGRGVPGPSLHLLCLFDFNFRKVVRLEICMKVRTMANKKALCCNIQSVILPDPASLEISRVPIIQFQTCHYHGLNMALMSPVEIKCSHNERQPRQENNVSMPFYNCGVIELSPCSYLRAISLGIEIIPTSTSS